MRFGVGLPLETLDLSADTLFEWMTRADSSLFATIAVTDEIVSHTLESMTVLAAAASVTRRVRLMSVVIAGPTRKAALLAKQAASIDMLSGGRLSLGLGVGELVDDFAIVGEDLRGRGRRFDEQLSLMKRIWAGEPFGDSRRAIGPPVQPGGPELLIGGWAPRALERIGRFADGYIGAALSHEMVSDEPYRMAERSWREHQREGRPRFVQNLYFALGTQAEDVFEEYLRVNYAGSSDYDQRAMRDVSPRSETAILEMVKRIAETGADDLIFHPVTSDIEEFNRLEHCLSSL